MRLVQSERAYDACYFIYIYIYIYINHIYIYIYIYVYIINPTFRGSAPLSRSIKDKGAEPRNVGLIMLRVSI